MKFLKKFFLALGFSLFVYTVQAADTFKFDPMHSYVLWTISHFGFSNQVGKFQVNGTLIFDKNKLQNSKVDVKIDLASITTGIEELNKHLKSEAFFDVAKYPQATFVSDKVKMIGKNKADVYGQLTLHGVTKPLVLHVSLNKEDINPISNKLTAGFSATASLKRSDFGMTTLIPGLGDTVELQIAAEAS